MLLKNFGVTRHGRVIFYDYDELCLLTECNFREIPRAANRRGRVRGGALVLGRRAGRVPRGVPRLPGPARRAGRGVHAGPRRSASVEFWRRMQELARAGEVIDFFPYRPSRRLLHSSRA